jgi:hypothetical protein
MPDDPRPVYAELQVGALVQLPGQRGLWMLEGWKDRRVMLRRVVAHDPPLVTPPDGAAYSRREAD